MFGNKYAFYVTTQNSEKIMAMKGIERNFKCQGLRINKFAFLNYGEYLL
jgi:hypothetical protein